MPIIYMSGESAEDWAAKGVPGSMMIAKPFAPAQLVTAISNVINEADMHLRPSGASSQTSGGK
jgi:DNA-binding response OmpR family regulator